jgi:hypothetical protein
MYSHISNTYGNKNVIQPVFKQFYGINIKGGICKVMMSRDIAVGIATACGLDDRGVGFRVPVGARFSPLHLFQTSLLSKGYRR